MNNIATNPKLSKGVLSTVLFFQAVVILSLGILASFRDIYSFSDTIQYYIYFEHVNQYEGLYLGYEFLFSIFVFFVSLITDHHEAFFFLWFLSILSVLSFSYIKIAEIGIKNLNLRDKIILLISLFSVILISRWFYSITTNGFRQGLSLGFTYMSLAYYANNRYKNFLFYFLLACFTHYSNFLFLPVLALIKLLKHWVN